MLKNEEKSKTTVARGMINQFNLMQMCSRNRGNPVKTHK